MRRSLPMLAVAGILLVPAFATRKHQIIRQDDPPTAKQRWRVAPLMVTNQPIRVVWNAIWPKPSVITWRTSARHGCACQPL